MKAAVDRCQPKPQGIRPVDNANHCIEEGPQLHWIRHEPKFGIENEVSTTVGPKYLLQFPHSLLLSENPTSLACRVSAVDHLNLFHELSARRIARLSKHARKEFIDATLLQFDEPPAFSGTRLEGDLDQVAELYYGRQVGDDIEGVSVRSVARSGGIKSALHHRWIDGPDALLLHEAFEDPMVWSDKRVEKRIEDSAQYELSLSADPSSREH